MKFEGVQIGETYFGQLEEVRLRKTRGGFKQVLTGRMLSVRFRVDSRQGDILWGMFDDGKASRNHFSVQELERITIR